MAGKPESEIPNAAGGADKAKDPAGGYGLGAYGPWPGAYGPGGYGPTTASGMPPWWGTTPGEQPSQPVFDLGQAVIFLRQALDHTVDSMKLFQRLRYILLGTGDGPIYLLGLIAGTVNTTSAIRQGSFDLLISTAYAQDGVVPLLGQGKNYVATLIFISFLISLIGAVFASGPGRTAAETFAKLLAGGLVGFVGGTRV